MKLMLERLSQDWLERWGHPLAMVESFVDPRFYQGTAYRVSGWSHLGRTAGWKRDAADFYLQHDAPKQTWVRELVKKARMKLRAPELPGEWKCAELGLTPRCRFKAGEICSLVDWLRKELVEFRRPQALAYPVAGVIGLIVMAMATGVRQGPEDLAQYADTLSPAQLRALRFRTDQHTGRSRCPKKTVFTRVLNAVDGQVLEGLLVRWQDQLLGPVQDRVVIADGKKMRHGGVEIVNAVSGSGRFLGGVITQDKNNEIPAARVVLLTGESLIVEVHGLLVCFEQCNDFSQTTARQGDVFRKFLGATNHSRLVEGRQPHGLGAIELRVLKRGESMQPVQHCGR